MKGFPKINRELSWLSFNHRVLQEAQDETVPLLERLVFLGIHSNNMDEFFRVRVATLNRLLALGKKGEEGYEDELKKVVKAITKKAQALSLEFDETFKYLKSKLKEEEILILNEKELSEEQQGFVAQYFDDHIMASVGPVMIDQVKHFPHLKDKYIYLAVKVETATGLRYGIMEVPTAIHSRFVVLPDKDNCKCVMFLDDVIRASLDKVFSTLEVKSASAYVFKITRDAELDIDNDIAPTFIEKMSKVLNQRKKGVPTRFVYDAEMPADLLDLIRSKIKLKSLDYEIASGRYHNLKDLMKFPSRRRQDLKYPKVKPLPHPYLEKHRSIMSRVEKKDVLLTFPYQSFNYFVNLIREASIDPTVTKISISIYRLAKNSQVANALILAAMNEKKVDVVIELLARFDEEANISWAGKFEEAGINLSYGVPNYKVHSKLLLIERKTPEGKKYTTAIGTGNFNEDTAQIYTDHMLLTSDETTSKEVKKVFDLIFKYDFDRTFKKIWVSPISMRDNLNHFIDQEIAFGKRGFIYLKVNNLVDGKIIKKLYQASQAGVKIQLLVRGVCCLIPGLKEISENIEARSIVDRYLEHSRIFVFGKGERQKIVLSSADLMNRNLNNRVEVAVPIESKGIRKELLDYLEMQWKANVKSRLLDEKQQNLYFSDGSKVFRAQEEIRKYYERKVE